MIQQPAKPVQNHGQRIYCRQVVATKTFNGLAEQSCPVLAGSPGNTPPVSGGGYEDTAAVTPVVLSSGKTVVQLHRHTIAAIAAGPC